MVPITFETSEECRVASGRWRDPYTGLSQDDPHAVDIDHLVPLEDAHNSGGWAWSSAKKREYANWLEDSDHLIAVTDGANRSKGERGPEDWQPPDEGHWCQYAVAWAEVKERWGLTMTQAEAEAVVEMLDTCEDPVSVVTETIVSRTHSGDRRTKNGVQVLRGGRSGRRDQVQGSGGRGLPKEMVPSARDGDEVICEQ